MEYRGHTGGDKLVSGEEQVCRGKVKEAEEKEPDKLLPRDAEGGLTDQNVDAHRQGGKEEAVHKDCRGGHPICEERDAEERDESECKS